MMTKEDKLSTEAKAARAAYMREWRKKNPEQSKRIDRNYWERRAQKMQEQEQEKA